MCVDVSSLNIMSLTGKCMTNDPCIKSDPFGKYTGAPVYETFSLFCAAERKSSCEQIIAAAK